MEMQIRNLVLALGFLSSAACAADISGIQAINNAMAADNLPLKALSSTSSPCAVATASTPLSCSGFYIGAGLAGQGSNADIIGSGINGSVFAGGMVPSADVGYQYVQGNWLFALEDDLGYALGSALTVNGQSGNVNGFRNTLLFKVGGNLAGLLGTASPITVPAALANSVLGLYAGVGPTTWQLTNTWVSGTSSAAGVLFDVSPKIFGDIRYTYTNFNGASVAGITVQNDQSVRVSLNYKF
jgi:opacity protein-like surface antigen